MSILDDPERPIDAAGAEGPPSLAHHLGQTAALLAALYFLLEGGYAVVTTGEVLGIQFPWDPPPIGMLGEFHPLAEPRYALLRALLSIRLLWLSACVVVLTPGLFRRRRWAWAGALGYLLVEGLAALSVVGMSVVAAFAFHSPQVLKPAAPAFYELGGSSTVALLLFKSREWFGVEWRRGWDTLRRFGWWSLALTLFLILAPIGAIILGSR